MVDKTLRIMIAEPRHSYALMIERILNQLGYFRIVPVRTLNEMCALSRCPNCTVDVLIAQAQFIASAAHSLDTVMGCYSETFFYECHAVEDQMSLHRLQGTMHQGSVDITRLGAFMAMTRVPRMCQKAHL